jgi:hypothetical protein
LTRTTSASLPIIFFSPLGIHAIRT